MPWKGAARDAPLILILVEKHRDREVHRGAVVTCTVLTYYNLVVDMCVFGRRHSLSHLGDALVSLSGAGGR